MITKPDSPSAIDKPTVPSPAQKPEGQQFTYNKISGWDKFKNWMGGIGSKLGLKTHEITDQDYVVNPKTGKSEFSWEQARKNDAIRGRATKTQFDPLPAIGIASKIATKGVM